MSRARLARARLPLRMLGAILGILLFIHLIHRAGPAKLLASMVALGWGLALVIAWGGVAHILKTWAWRLTLLDGKYHVSFARMLGLRLSSEAVGQWRPRTVVRRRSARVAAGPDNSTLTQYCFGDD